MPTDIGREELQRLMADGAQVVDVRPEEEFSDEHILGAIHLHLKSIDASAVGVLDRSRAVVVY